MYENKKKLLVDGIIYIVPCYTEAEEKKLNKKAEKEYQEFLKTGKSAASVKGKKNVRNFILSL